MFTKFKIPAMVCLTIVAGVTLAIAGTGANKWYPTNQAPLKQTKYVLLPVATVKPAGWLHKELSLWANGLTGHLYELDAGSQDDIARFVKNSKWRSDAYSGDRWEAGPYYLNGLMPLAYLLDDARLIAECQTWANNMLKHRTDWFANVSGDDMWASSIAWQCLRSWFEARGERPEDTAAFYALTRNYFNLINTGNWGSNTWAWTRGGENFLALQWFHRRTGASNIPSIAQSVKSKVCDWTPIYNTMRSGNNDLRNPQGWYMQGHVVNHGMAIKFGSAYWPFATATAADSQAGVTAYEKMLKYHGHILGAFTGDESLAGLKAWHGLETCGCVETMYSLENMIEMFGKVEWADNLEYLAYNNLPGRYTPDGWNRQYHSQVNQVSISSAPRSWMSSNVDANIYGNFNTLFRCCTVNMHQGWPKFVVNSWMATQDNGLVAPVYGPTTITAKVGSGATPATVTINETTEYPFKNIVTFTIGATSAPTAFPLVVRVPLWGKGTSIVAAGATIAGSGSPTNLDAGQWVTISKTWNTGDQVTVTLPFTIRAEKIFQNGGSSENFTNPGLVVCRGPMVFSLKVAATWTNKAYNNCMGAARWSLASSDGKWNYALCVDQGSADRFARSFTVVEKSIDAKFPWAGQGDKCYDAASNTFKDFTGDYPVYLQAKAKRVSSWGIRNNSADEVPTSPQALSSVPMEDVVLIPYGCSRLRTTVFPWSPITVEEISSSLIRAPKKQLVKQATTAKGIVFTLEKAAQHKIDIMTMSGKVVKSFSGSAAATYVLPKNTLAQNVYVVRAKVGPEIRMSKLAVE